MAALVDQSLERKQRERSEADRSTSPSPESNKSIYESCVEFVSKGISAGRAENQRFV